MGAVVCGSMCTSAAERKRCTRRLRDVGCQREDKGTSPEPTLGQIEAENGDCTRSAPAQLSRTVHRDPRSIEHGTSVAIN